MIVYCCPYCGMQSVTEQPQQVQCLNCGAVLYPGSGQLPGEQFVPDTAGQTAGMQTMQQPYPQQMQQPYPQMPQRIPAAAQETPEQQRRAQKLRRGWRLSNAAMLMIQTFLVGMGLFLDANDHALCPFLFLMWMATVPLFAILSPALRPDDAYKTKKPLIPNKFIHFLAQLVLGLLTFVSGAVMFAIAEALFM